MEKINEEVRTELLGNLEYGTFDMSTFLLKLPKEVEVDFCVFYNITKHASVTWNMHTYSQDIDEKTFWHICEYRDHKFFFKGYY